MRLRPDLRQEAEDWMEAHPKAYKLFVRFAFQMANAKRCFGIGLITERVRWEVATTWKSADGFKINNNHRAYIMRRIVEEHPHIEPFVHLREVRS